MLRNGRVMRLGSLAVCAIFRYFVISRNEAIARSFGLLFILSVMRYMRLP